MVNRKAEFLADLGIECWSGLTHILNNVFATFYY